MASQGEILAENGIFALFRPKIRTWTTMPLKGHIIATFRGLLSDCSLPGNSKKSISRKLAPGDKKSTGCRYIQMSNSPVPDQHRNSTWQLKKKFFSSLAADPFKD
jgi:hypothetical protein